MESSECYGSRPDIKATGEEGGLDLIDVAITLMIFSTISPFQALSSYFGRKISHHQNQTGNLGQAKVRPIIRLAIGGWHVELLKFMSRAAKQIITHGGFTLETIAVLQVPSGSIPDHIKFVCLAVDFKG